MRTATRVALGVTVTTVVFGLLILFVGVERFVDTIASVDPVFVAVIVAIIAVRRIAQGSILYVAFNRFGVDVSLLQAVFLSASTSFAKNVTPFGQFGGEPVAAGIVTDAVREPYENCLAALSTVETIRFIPSTTIFLFGSLYFVAFPAPVPAVVEPLFGLFGLFLFVVVLLAVAVWKFQDAAEVYVTRMFVYVVDAVSVLPLVSGPGEDDIRDRVTGFSSLFVDLTTDPRLVVSVTALSFSNTFLTVSELWLALRAVGVAVPFPIVLFAVPFSQLASILPSPGGVGGIEGVLVVFITALVGASIKGVTTGVVLSSGLGYWMTMSAGGLGIAVVLPVLSNR